MTIKRLMLTVLTAIAVGLVFLSLIASWNQPQIQSRLELYQTNLLLDAAEFEAENPEDPTAIAASRFLGQAPFQAALKQYQEALESAETTLEQTHAQLEELESANKSTPATSDRQKQLEQSSQELETLSEELSLRSGILLLQQGETEKALATWAGPEELPSPNLKTTAKTARVLLGLWSEPPRIGRDSEELIEQNLEGWFRYRALTQLYQLQERQEKLLALEEREQQLAEEALVKLAIISGIPGLGFIFGLAVLIFLFVQRLVKPEESILALGKAGTEGQSPRWETPWDWETIWQVLVVGFFFVGQVVVPLVLSVLNLPVAELGARSQAFYILGSYLLLAFGGLLVLYLCLKPFFPLPEGWFRFRLQGRWFWWGLGGYLAAMPLVLVVSLLNQQLWQGRGGSNPMLPIVLEGRDSIAIAVFLITASVAAPLFEEIIFRGFLLPSLTRYLSAWGAIAASALIFAIAHLQLSELLPLATLGAVLGFTYARSGNLLAPMLLHCLWNSGTLLSLFVLGSGAI